MTASVPRHLRWLWLEASDLAIERRQCEEEGRDLASVQEEFEHLARADLKDPALQDRARRLLDRTAALPVRPDHRYDEPSDLPSIQAARRPGPTLGPLALDEAALEARLHAAWVARACGCLLGKPVEGWHRPRMWGYLKDAGRWPLAAYISRRVPAAVQERYQLATLEGCADEVSCMPEDDDLNYTVLALALLERHGPDFTPRDVATFWLEHLPVLHTCTAERVAYRNLCLAMEPPDTATHRNPYREWIGAQIRGDLFGYVAPGRPALAAELAWRDASISHVRNGIYGEMWVAAMIAAAFVTDDLPTILEAGLAQVPARSRLVEAVDGVLSWFREGLSYEEAVARIHQRWDERDSHDWCHTLSNACIVATGLLWGERDGPRTLCRAVQPCFDTDCNGATAGSILGAAFGARLPVAWTAPLHDTLETGVAGNERVTLSQLADRTVRVASRVLAH